MKTDWKQTYILIYLSVDFQHLVFLLSRTVVSSRYFLGFYLLLKIDITIVYVYIKIERLIGSLSNSLEKGYSSIRY